MSSVVLLDSPAKAPELSPEELRALLSQGEVIELSEVYSDVRDITGGEPVGAHAYDLGDVYYMILVLMPGGNISNLVIRAETGRIVPKGSAIARTVEIEAQETGHRRQLQQKKPSALAIEAIPAR
jgi:hypothetical protein